MLKNINLQLFADDDAILPDDFTPPEVNNTAPATEPVEDTTKTEPVQTQPQEEPKPTVKLKYNHEEKEYSLDDVVPLAQKGLNYDKVMEQYNTLKSDPSYAFVVEQAKMYGLSPTEYIQAVKQQQEKQELDKLVQQNIPEQFAREMLENRKFREQIKAEKQTAEQTQKQNAQFEEFLNAYPEVKAEEIPPEVWNMQANGKNLTDAYAIYENKQLKAQLKALQHNEEVAKSTPVGGVTAHGTAEVTAKDPFELGFDSVK